MMVTVFVSSPSDRCHSVGIRKAGTVCLPSRLAVIASNTVDGVFGDGDTRRQCKELEAFPYFSASPMNTLSRISH